MKHLKLLIRIDRLLFQFRIGAGKQHDLLIGKIGACQQQHHDKRRNPHPDFRAAVLSAVQAFQLLHAESHILERLPDDFPQFLGLPLCDQVKLIFLFCRRFLRRRRGRMRNLLTVFLRNGRRRSRFRRFGFRTDRMPFRQLGFDIHRGHAGIAKSGNFFQYRKRRIRIDAALPLNGIINVHGVLGEPVIDCCPRHPEKLGKLDDGISLFSSHCQLLSSMRLISSISF